jgi:ParB-like chromosome segregation protein Spo0J
MVLAGIEGGLPPLLVHRGSMRVIDGMHRLAAARRRGDTHVEVLFYDGTPEDAFVLGVRANTSHGRPLTLDERRHSARRILASHPDWSDRAISAVCGLSPSTVASLRHRDGDGPGRLKRLGRDGRRRPSDTTEARREAARLLGENPNLSLRHVARATGISPGTVRDVRDRLRRGDRPELTQVTGQVFAGGDERPPETLAGALDQLSHDSALLATPEGKDLLDWLADHLVTDEDWEDRSLAVPVSRVYLVAAAARACAKSWSAFADELERRLRR